MSAIHSLRDLLVGRTITDVRFTDEPRLGERDITIVLDNGEHLEISAFDESLYFLLEDENGKFNFDTFFS